MDNSAIDTMNYIVVWQDHNAINFKRVYNNGQAVTFEDRFIYFSQTETPRIVSFKNHKAFVTWNPGNEVQGLLFNDNIQSLEGYLLHRFESSEKFWGETYTSWSTDIYNDKLFFTYESARAGDTGYDIWGNVQYIGDAIDFNPQLFFPPANDDVLYQNFPNPFNARTRIVYQLFTLQKVKITVYDVMGREVRVLVDQYQSRGVHEVEFDGSDLPSGIYFCRMEAFRSHVIKLLLIK